MEELGGDLAKDGERDGVEHDAALVANAGLVVWEGPTSTTKLFEHGARTDAMDDLDEGLALHGGDGARHIVAGNDGEGVGFARNPWRAAGEEPTGLVDGWEAAGHAARLVWRNIDGLGRDTEVAGAALARKELPVDEDYAGPRIPLVGVGLAPLAPGVQLDAGTAFDPVTGKQFDHLRRPISVAHAGGDYAREEGEETNVAAGNEVVVNRRRWNEGQVPLVDGQSD
ncbi:MAG: hypothetical protein QM778_18400 [Myxococcales bacterium]